MNKQTASSFLLKLKQGLIQFVSDSNAVRNLKAKAESASQPYL